LCGSTTWCGVRSLANLSDSMGVQYQCGIGKCEHKVLFSELSAHRRQCAHSPIVCPVDRENCISLTMKTLLSHVLTHSRTTDVTKPVVHMLFVYLTRSDSEAPYCFVVNGRVIKVMIKPLLNQLHIFAWCVGVEDETDLYVRIRNCSQTHGSYEEVRVRLDYSTGNENSSKSVFVASSYNEGVPRASFITSVSDVMAGTVITWQGEHFAGPAMKEKLGRGQTVHRRPPAHVFLPFQPQGIQGLASLFSLEFMFEWSREFDLSENEGDGGMCDKAGDQDDGDIPPNHARRRRIRPPRPSPSVSDQDHQNRGQASVVPATTSTDS